MVSHAMIVCLCQVCSLERFRSLQDKLHLLEEAVSTHDGNVITAVSGGLVLVPGENPLKQTLTFWLKCQVSDLEFLLEL